MPQEENRTAGDRTDAARRRRRADPRLHRVRRLVRPERSEEALRKLAEEGDYLYRMFEVAPLNEEAVYDLTMVNEDYYLSDEELIEYYTVGAVIRELDYIDGRVALRPVNEPERDLLAVEVLVDGDSIGYVDPRSCSYVYRYLEDARIVNVRVLLGGGRYKQIVSADDRMPYEIPQGRKAVDHAGDAIDMARQEERAEPEETKEAVQTGQIMVRSREIPIYAYVCMAIRRGNEG